MQSSVKNNWWESFSLVSGKVWNLQQKRLIDGNVELTWNEPFAKGNDVITYLVMYGGLTKKTKERKFVIESDTQDESYHVEVLVIYYKIISRRKNLQIPWIFR